MSSYCQLFRITGPRCLSVVLGLLTGCSNLSQPEAPLHPVELQPVVTRVADRPFDTETLYALLVAEFAGERKRFDVMLNNYAQQAHTTRDPGVTARATRIARFLNAHNISLDMALLWSELEPWEAEARYSAAAELVHVNRLEEAFEHASRLLTSGETTGFDVIGARALQGGDLTVTHTLIKKYERMILKHPNHTPLHIGLSFLAQHAGDLPKAIESARFALTLEPDNFQAAGQEARLLQQMGQTEQALEKLGQLVNRHPENQRLRLQYARALLNTDLKAAQHQFEQMLLASPDDEDLITTLGLIQFERGMLQEAIHSFEQLLSSRERRSTGHFYLGRIAASQQDSETAIYHLSQVPPGQDYLPALALLTDILIGQNKRQTAIEYVQEQRVQTPPENREQREGLYLLEANLYSTGGRYESTLNVLQQAITELPQSSKLHYARAILYTRLDRIGEAEKDLRTVLSIAPDNAAALNALGYTLVDRTERLDEAAGYINRAYELTPDDPAVIDSLGWLQYRRGNIDEALTYLRKAMRAMPDPEIAAHLGEVLWVAEKHDEARKVWQEGLALEPNSPIIRDTLERLQVNLD